MRSLAWILALVVVFVGVAAGETRAPEPQLRVAALPLSFEPNLGQADSQVGYLARGDGYTLFLTPTEAVFRLQGDGARAVVRMKLAGGNAKALMSGVEILPGKSNYLLGSDPAQWRAGIPQYARVRLDNVYPGIDLVYYSADEGQLEYDFIVAPGADPTAIQFRLAGAGKLGLDPEGDLVLHLGAQQIRWRRPLVYQEIDGHRVELEEIEFHARAFCGDQQVVATVNTSEEGSHYILLFVESESDIRKGLAEYLRTHLPEYMIPKQTIAVSRFPLNSNGKVDRKALVNDYMQTFACGSTGPFARLKV